MSFNLPAPFAAAVALAVLASGITACSQDESGSTPTVTATEAVEASPSMEQSMETPEPTGETSEPVDQQPSDEPLGPNDESGVVDVTVVGDQGILALQNPGAAPAGEAGPTHQKLITGPGGCFALTNEGKPRLVIFPADATFVLEEGKPSATFGGTEHPVGRELDVVTTAVSKMDVAGIPDVCAEGADDIVIVVN